MISVPLTYIENLPSFKTLISRKENRPCWIVIVLVSIGLGVFFLVTNLIDYLGSTTVTTLETTTSSLENIYYPSITVCNMNQIR